MAKLIRIASWNANGLPNHKYELLTFINTYNIDIMLISETHFTEKTVFQLPKFKTYSTEHPDGRAHGGSAILIRESIKHHTLTNYVTKEIQASNIRVFTETWSFDISAIYSPPRHNISEIQYKTFFQNFENRFLVGGDWNAKHFHWGSRLINPKGRNLIKIIMDKNYEVISSGTPTYWPTDPNKIPDILDFFVSNGISNNYINVEPTSDLSSDHSPILLTISTSAKFKDNKPTLVTGKTNWEMFKSILTRDITLDINLQQPEHLEAASNYVTEMIQKAAWESTPPTTRKNTFEAEIPLETRELLKDKRRARKRWQRSRNPIDKTICNQYSRKLHKILQEHFNSKFENHLQQIDDNNDYNIWKATKKLKRPTIRKPPIKTLNGDWAKSDEEKANTFAAHLHQVFSPDHPQSSNIEEEIEAFLDVACQMSLPIKPFISREVWQEIKKLKNKKAPGYDLITAEILKKLPKEVISLLTKIFNRMMSLSYFPTIWKYAEIIMIHKVNKPENDVKSYRPISLLPVIGKLFEKLILKRLKSDINLHDIIPDHQLGFRQNHSTAHQIHRIVNTISTSIEENKFCSAVFLDSSQAFDKVWHKGLLYKLKKLLPQPYFVMFKSYLTNRHFAVKYEGAISPTLQIRSGVPQGSILGPVLYLIYTSDLPTHPNSTIATYADDVAVLSTHENAETASEYLQLLLNQLEGWYRKWRLKINETKSVHVTFTNKRSLCPPVKINNKQIPISTEAKYLGIHLDQRLNWRKHIQAKKQQINLKIRSMYWLIGRKSKLSLKNKLLIYKAIIKPIWTYGIQFWGCAKPSNKNIIQRTQSKILRTLTDAPWYVSNLTIHNDLGIPFIEEEIRNRFNKYQQNLQGHENNLINQLVESPFNIRRLKRTWPVDLN